MPRQTKEEGYDEADAEDNIQTHRAARNPSFSYAGATGTAIFILNILLSCPNHKLHPAPVDNAG
jgi:hypothetical protein